MHRGIAYAVGLPEGVPMILWIPGVEGGGHFDTPVENIDLVPTLLDSLDIPTHEQGFEGASLRPLIEGREYPDQYAFSDQGRYEAVADSEFHLIFDRAESTAALFDVAADPLEQHNLFVPGHPAVGPLKAAVSGWLEATGLPAGSLDKLAAAKAQEDQLSALGYLE
jgi:arylsulfatase A-like enzyme